MSNSQTKALNSKILSKFFSKNQPKVVGKGFYVEKLGKSKAGPCKFCKSMRGVHRIGGNKPQPPHHPNCRCSVKAI